MIKPTLPQAKVLHGLAAGGHLTLQAGLYYLCAPGDPGLLHVNRTIFRNILNHGWIEPVQGKLFKRYGITRAGRQALKG